MGRRGDNLRNRGVQYDPKHHPLIVKWAARNGLTVPKIVAEIGISQATFYKWLKAHPELKEALTHAREVSDGHVEDALFKKATGYDYTETRTVIEKDAKGGEKRKHEKIIRHVPASDIAMKFWLVNRKPGQWRDQPVPDVDPNALVEADQALASAEMPSGTEPALPQPGPVQDSSSGPTFGQDGTGQA